MSKIEVWPRRLNYYFMLLQIIGNENVSPIIPAGNDLNYFIDVLIFHDHLSASLLLSGLLCCPQTSVLKGSHLNILLRAYIFWSLFNFCLFKLPLTEGELLRACNLLLEETEDAKGWERAEEGRVRCCCAFQLVYTSHPRITEKSNELRYATCSSALPYSAGIIQI